MVENEKRGMKVCIISDFDFRSSGYFNISVALGSGLAKRGHEVIAAGLGYRGEEHDFPMSIIPCMSMQEVFAVTQNLSSLWGFDIMLVIMDIPIQESFINSLANKDALNYVGIMPVEADPLCTSWALALMQMDKALIISEFGTEEARKIGVDAVYLPVGIDTTAWRPPTPEERIALRKSFGFEEDEFVFLTVAYNQERKLLSRGMEMFADFIYGTHNSEEYSGLSPIRKAKYAMVTAEHSPVGWRLRDLAQELKISDKFVLFERGIPHKTLWGIYAASDAFLLPSKAEGLGMILLEAMSVGIPCLGTDCTGIRELLSDGRGKLIPYDYTIRDPFGNGKRYYADRLVGTGLMSEVCDGDNSEIVKKAKAYVQTRTWDKAVDILESELMKILEAKNGKKEETK